MKKVLSVLSLIAVLSMTTPCYASPHGGPHGHGYGPGPGRGHIVTAGPGMHRPPHHHGGHWGPPPPRHHGIGFSVSSGVLARRGYWSYPYDCTYRIGWDDFCYRPVRYYPPVSTGFYIRF